MRKEWYGSYTEFEEQRKKLPWRYRILGGLSCDMKVREEAHLEGRHIRKVARMIFGSGCLIVAALAGLLVASKTAELSLWILGVALYAVSGGLLAYAGYWFLQKAVEYRLFEFGLYVPEKASDA